MNCTDAVQRLQTPSNKTRLSGNSVTSCAISEQRFTSAKSTAIRNYNHEASPRIELTTIDRNVAIALEGTPEVFYAVSLRNY